MRRCTYEIRISGRYPPESNEYAPYYGKYVSLVPDGDILVHAGKAIARDAGAAPARTESDGDFRYAPGSGA